MLLTYRKALKKGTKDMCDPIIELKPNMSDNKDTEPNAFANVVKHTKHKSNSKTKSNDYLEGIKDTLNKPVGKTHNSSYIFMGKKKA